MRGTRRPRSLWIPPSPKILNGLGGHSLSAMRPRGGVPRNKICLSIMNMSENLNKTPEAFGTSDRLGDAVSGVTRSSSCEGNLRMGAASQREENATAAKKLEETMEISGFTPEEDTPSTFQRHVDTTLSYNTAGSPQVIKGKRKTFASPEANPELENLGTPSRRPNKARIIEYPVSTVTAEQSEPMEISEYSVQDLEEEDEEERILSIREGRED